MSDEQRTGYESGFQENSGRTESYQSNRGYGSGGGRDWNNPHGPSSGGQSRNFPGGGRKPGGFGNQPPRDFDKDPAVFYKPYFVASNDQPPPSQELVQRAAKIRDYLAHFGFIVRTAMMNDLDKVFADCKSKELMLPFKDWNKIESKFTFVSEEAKQLAKQKAPHWDTITKPVVQTFLAKNVRLALGQNCKSQARFGLIYSVDGAQLPEETSRDTGNMKHVIEVAREVRIPIFNLQRPDTQERLFRYLELTLPT